ncbi:MAG: hypothetical protein AB1894_08390 [Chloroflexota bacterium]
MTTPQISSRDWEAMSAYLDGQLAQKERSRLEARLREDAALRSGMEELHRTRAVLRRQPGLRAPRNFTLTPQMAGLHAGRRTTSSAFATLRLASVLATIFFAIVFIGDLTTGGMQPKTAVFSEALREPAPLVGGMGGGGPEDQGLPLLQEKAVEVAPTEEAKGTAMAFKLEVTPLPTQATETSLPAALLAPSDVHTDTLTDEKSQSNLAPDDEQALPIREKVSVTWAWRWSILQVLQVLLALLAVITGLAAFFVRRGEIR